MTDTKSEPQGAPLAPHISDEGEHVTLGSIADDKIGTPQEAILREVDAALERIATGIAAEKKALDALIERISRKKK